MSLEVTNHACDRFAERVIGVNEIPSYIKVKSFILTLIDNVAVDAVGDCSYPLKDFSGYYAVIVNNKVVTIKGK